MTSFSSDISSSNSTMSTLLCEDNENFEAKSIVKDLLKSRIFLGRYLERRLVDNRVLYRDIVLVSAAETELNRDLLEAKQKLKSIYPASHWVGITSTELLDFAPSGTTCIWTEIENQPFGPFWFQIKTVLFRENEVLLKLKCIRYISESFLELEPLLTRGSGSKPKVVKVKTNETKLPDDENFIMTLKNVLTISNLKEFVTFFIALTIAIFTGSTTFVTFVGNFILSLIRETSYFIKSSTPLFLGFLDFFSKIVGGFYILLAMFFKPAPTVSIRNRNQNYRPIDYNTHNDKYFD